MDREQILLELREELERLRDEGDKRQKEEEPNQSRVFFVYKSQFLLAKYLLAYLDKLEVEYE